MSGLSGSIGLTLLLFTVLLWPSLVEVDQRVDAITQQVNLNNVPEIKEDIKTILEKIDSLEDTTIRIETSLKYLIDKP